MPEMREYRCEQYRLKAPPTCCLFCSHCSDVFWDFTHGPYMFFCDAGADTEEGIRGRCNSFNEEVDA